MVRQRPFLRIQQLVPHALRRRLQERRGNELGLRVEVRAALGTHRTHEHAQELQAARDLPAAKIA